ncbi:uncharacterized protein N7487_011547 [Penicillium crustosum]|uniref:uncharacterized protein n=1 Tax=Penicillium crustosum TaxID=36656 RepID=UPI0023851CD7|nr:uncharacterized protein N7487_011547 [Penicillium crustosum]KAJ5393906.1 hypothetical protein N7487_011547 [Penicillium crustosum]
MFALKEYVISAPATLVAPGNSTVPIAPAPSDMLCRESLSSESNAKLRRGAYWWRVTVIDSFVNGRMQRAL